MENIKLFDFKLDDLFDAPRGETLYSPLFPKGPRNKRTKTQIWQGKNRRGQWVCIKEYFAAEAPFFSREIPDPIWKSQKLDEKNPDPARRGLSLQRSALYTKFKNFPPLEKLKATLHDPQFAKILNAYSFEIEALVGHIARQYRLTRLPPPNRKGPLILPKEDESPEPSPHFSIETPWLEPLQLPHPKSDSQIISLLVEMFEAVAQLHSALVPIELFPPELISNLPLARNFPFVRLLHFDLSPNQFMVHPDTKRVVLIDFNSARPNCFEFDNFFWVASPYQPFYQFFDRPRLFKEEDFRRRFIPGPFYDLYSLGIIALFLISRDNPRQTRITQIKGFETLEKFKKIPPEELLQRIREKIASWPHSFRYTAIIELLEALLRPDLEEKIEAVRELLQVDPLKDWSLLPRAMDLLARELLERRLTVRWNSETLTIAADTPPREISALVEEIQWYSGVIPSPQPSPSQLTFFQTGPEVPALIGEKLFPLKPGEYKIFASYEGCVDWNNPLNLRVVAAESPQAELHHLSKGPKLAEIPGDYPTPQPSWSHSDNSPEKLNLISSPPQSPKTQTFEREKGSLPSSENFSQQSSSHSPPAGLTSEWTPDQTQDLTYSPLTPEKMEVDNSQRIEFTAVQEESVSPERDEQSALSFTPTPDFSPNPEGRFGPSEGLSPWGGGSYAPPEERGESHSLADGKTLVDYQMEMDYRSVYPSQQPQSPLPYYPPESAPPLQPAELFQNYTYPSYPPTPAGTSPIPESLERTDSLPLSSGTIQIVEEKPPPEGEYYLRPDQAAGKLEVSETIEDSGYPIPLDSSRGGRALEAPQSDDTIEEDQQIAEIASLEYYQYREKIYREIKEISDKCIEKLRRRELKPRSKELRKLASIYSDKELTSIERGFCLNNLTVLCYSLQFYQKNSIFWREVFGFDPLRELENWRKDFLENLEDNPPSLTNQWELLKLEKMEVKTRETIELARAVKEYLREKG